MAPPGVASTRAVWWATDLSVSDGAAVSSWVDRVNGFTVSQATSARRPTFDADGLNGRPALLFDGSDDFLGLNASGALSTATQGCVVAVVRPTAFTGRVVWASSDVATIEWNVLGSLQSNNLAVQQKQIVGARGSSDIVRGKSTLSAVPQLWEWASNGTAYSLRLNNVIESPYVVQEGSNSGDWFGDTPNRDNFTIGALLRTALVTPTYAGHIAFLGIYDAPLSNADRTALYAWLHSYYFAGWNYGLHLGGSGWGGWSGG